MADIKRVGSENPGEIIVPDGVAEFIRKIVTRREFLQVSGAVGLGVATFSLVGCGSSSTADATPRQVFVANAQGMIVAEPSRCVGCRRCELACSEFNDGKSMPSISRIKVGRNYNVGPSGPTLGIAPAGRHLGQPSHRAGYLPPVPAPGALPAGLPSRRHRGRPPGQRQGGESPHKCEGCGICTKACPWAMTSLDGPVDGANTKATKCIPLPGVRRASVRRGL